MTPEHHARPRRPRPHRHLVRYDAGALPLRCDASSSYREKTDQGSCRRSLYRRRRLPHAATSPTAPTPSRRSFPGLPCIGRPHPRRPSAVDPSPASLHQPLGRPARDRRRHLPRDRWGPRHHRRRLRSIPGLLASAAQTPDAVRRKIPTGSCHRVLQVLSEISKPPSPKLLHPRRICVPMRGQMPYLGYLNPWIDFGGRYICIHELGVVVNK